MAFLGPNDFFVLEKATGKVQHVVDVHRKRSARIVEIAERVDLMTAARDGRRSTT
jgi:hypothetical protein